jgi:hypothetical protein
MQRSADATAARSDTATKPLDEFISIAEAAKQIGINKSTLSRQVKAKAVRSHNGKVRLSEVYEDRANNIDLSQSRRRSTKTPAAAPAAKLDATAQADATPSVLNLSANVSAPDSDATDDGAGDDLVLVDGALLTFAQASCLKENYLARKHKLSFEVARGALVDRGAAVKAFFEAARENRDAWTAWPARIATLLAADLGADERVVAETLARYVQQHLAELGEPNEPALAPPD